MGTPDFALPSLDALARGPDEVVAVYTQPDRAAGRGRRVVASPVKRWAEEAGIPVLTPTSFRKPEVIEELRGWRPDVVVVAAYGKLLPREVLGVPARGVLNVHPSLLPRHRGASPVASAILNGDPITGVTIMLLDEGLDSGPVLAREEEAVLGTDTTETLTNRLAEMGARLLVATLPRWTEGLVEAIPQEESDATVCRRIAVEDAEIDWTASADRMWRQVRAYQPWPGSFTWWRGERLKILEGEPLEGPSPAPGLVVPITGEGQSGIGVHTGQGLYRLGRVQPSGGKAMTGEAFAAGRREFVGSRLPDGRPG